MKKNKNTNINLLQEKRKANDYQSRQSNIQSSQR